MRLKTISVLIVSLFFIGLESYSQVPEYGLYIQTFPQSVTEFTSLALDNGQSIATSGNQMTISFKVWNRKDNAFGTVLRVITDKGKNIDVMYSANENENRYPMLVIGDQTHALPQDIPYNQWIDVHLTIDPTASSVTLDYNHTPVRVSDADISHIEGIRIAFGLCPFEGYMLDNVASVNLKDISLQKDQKTIRRWKMDFHQEDTCFDEISRRPAVGINTNWLLDKHITWKNIYSKSYKESPMIAFDSINGIFYISTDKEKITAFHPADGTEETIQSKGGAFAATYPNQLMYIPQANKLLSYNLDENNPKDSTLVSFGGYGHYHYNNDLTISYPFKGKTIQRRKKLLEIHPRFSPASTIVDDVLYVFGGKGCPSGKAELSPKNYYDLSTINLNTLETTLLWESSQEPENGHFLPSDNMIYDAAHDCFYFFCTQQGGVLMKMNKEEAGFKPMSLPIYKSISAQYLYTNLYYSPRQEKLYTVIQQTQVNGEADIQLYELDFPPFPVHILQQAEENQTADTSLWHPLLYGLLAVGLTASAVGGVRHLIRRKAGKNDCQETAEPPMEAEGKYTDYTHATPLPEAEIPEFHNYDLEHQAIRFFGGFKVMDREGNDITASFTPTLKALLILLILYTGKDPKGISGHRIIQTLWSDKLEESAKNSRNVYMSKLRNLLDKVGDVSIINRNGFWSIRFEQDCLCDYLEAIRLYQQNDSEDLERLVELLLHGAMLPNMEIDWIDKFKSDFSNYTIDLLSRVLKRDDLPDNFRVKIADTLFLHDYINEEALAEKCRILCKQGKKGLAKTIYNSFCKEYALSLGTDYPVPMIELIKDR